METKIRELEWSLEDTPLPKKGQILENIYHEKYKVLSCEKRKDHALIRMERIGI